MAKVLFRNPNVAGAAGHVHAPAKRGLYGSIGAPKVPVTCEGYKDHVLCIKNDSIVLVPSSTQDVHKVWEKDDSWGDGFALVNSDTNQAIKRPNGPGQRLLLVPYSTTQRDNTVMWTKDNDDTACPIREHDDSTLVFDTLERGRDILVIAAKEKATTNQKWKIT